MATFRLHWIFMLRWFPKTTAQRYAPGKRAALGHTIILEPSTPSAIGVACRVTTRTLSLVRESGLALGAHDVAARIFTAIRRFGCVFPRIDGEHEVVSGVAILTVCG